MRLVDLLLLPRQQSYGVSSNDSLYRHPLGSAYLRSKNSEELKSNMKTLEFYRRQDSGLGQQPTEKSFRSTGSLSDLLRSKKSPTSPGYWNHATANPPPSSAAVETTLRLAQDSKPRVGLINGFVKQESDENCGFTTTTARGCFDDDRRPFPTMDKTLNGNIWNREELSSPSSSSSVSKFFPSLSSSSSSSSPSSASSLGLDDRALFHRRRISLLSSDGSELEPEQILTLATDSDGYESLSSSPLEAVDSAALSGAAGAAGAFRWTEHGPDASFGYLDWHGGGGGGEGEGEGEAERGGYDIDACPLFNFNFLENTLDDCPFESFDTKDTIPRFDESGFCDSPMVSMVPDVIMATETMKNCSSFSDRDDVQSSSFRGHLFKLNELDRRTRHGMKINDGSDLSDFPPSSSVTALPGIPAAPVSNMETLQQSEVVKLLLQNRHQWAVPQEKVPSPPVGCRGSRKRASAATNGRDVGRAKVPRETRPYNDVPSNEESSLPYAPFARANSFSASVLVDGQDRYDQSSSLEKLITELMLFESTKSDSEGDDVARNSPSEATSAAALPPYAELFTPSLSLHPSELFDGLAACRISDTELFSSLDLESVYLSDCEPFAALGDGLDFENAKSFDAFVKTEPDKAPFLSLPPSPTSSSSLCHPESFGHRPVGRNWLGGEDAPSSSRNDGCPTIVDGHKSSVLERILQTNLLFDSLDCDAKLVASGGRGGFVSDHDYCQNLEVLSLDAGALDLTCDLRYEKRRRTEISPSSCYVRKRDYSALKSLLLDSNLTEEVRKEVELDRAKSRKKMSEKLKVTSVNDPARLQRLGRIRDNRILKQHLENENYDPCFDVDPSNSETMESSSCPPQEEKCAAFGDQSLAPVGRCSPAAGLLPRRDLGSGTARPELPAETGDDNNTLVTSDLELSGGDDAVFFNSFEDFYSKNQREIESSHHHHHQSNASNDDENDDPTTKKDDDSSLTEFEPKVRRNKRKSAISKRVRVYRSVGRGGLKVARSPPRMRRSSTGTGRPLVRTGKDRSVNHRRRKTSNSTRHLRPKSPPISNNRSAL